MTGLVPKVAANDYGPVPNEVNSPAPYCPSAGECQ